MNTQLTFDQEVRIRELMGSMSLREKIGQMVCVQLAAHIGKKDSEMADFKEKIDAMLELAPIGNVFIGAEIIQETQGGADRIHEVLQYLQSKSSIPCLVAGDIEYGVGASVKGLTVFPNNITFAAIDSPELAYETGRLTGLEARAVGFNWCFGPVVDLFSSWIGCGNARNISDDPDMTVKIARALIQGMQDGGMMACAKHFPDGSQDFRNPHITNTVNHSTEKEWYATVGKIYRELAQDNLMSVMSGHVSLLFAEEFNQEQNACCPGSLSARTIQGILREKIGFDGVVVTDSSGMGGFRMWKNNRARIEDVFNAGNDIYLFPKLEDLDIIEDAVLAGRIPMSRIDESVFRILRAKMLIGLMDEPQDTYGDLPAIRAETEKLNRLLSQKSIACLRNLDNLLPLNAEKVKRILVLRLDRGGEKGVVSNFIHCLENMGLEVDVYGVADLADWDKPVEMHRAEKQGRRWDAYLQLYNYAYIGEYRPGGPVTQAYWRASGLETVKPILISFGTPYLLYDIPNAKTFVTTFFGKSPFIPQALTDALFGKALFTETIPIQNYCEHL